MGSEFESIRRSEIFTSELVSARRGGLAQMLVTPCQWAPQSTEHPIRRMTRHVVVDEVSDGVFADYRHCIHGGAKKLRRLNAWPPLEFGDIQWTEQKERLLRNCILNHIKFEKWVEKFQIREVGELGVMPGFYLETHQDDRRQPEALLT